MQTGAWNTNGSRFESQRASPSNPNGIESTSPGLTRSGYPGNPATHTPQPCKGCIPPRIRRWTAGGAVPKLRDGTPAMTDTPPEFAEDVRKCAGDSGRREAGGKELAKQKAEGLGCGSSRCPCVEKGAEVCAKA